MTPALPTPVMQASYPALNGATPLLFVTFPAKITDPTTLQHYADLLTPDESARWRRFHFPHDRHVYLIARALLKTVLAHYAGTPAADLSFVAGPFGKPALQGRPDLAFNLSHCRGSVAVAIGRSEEVGVDVEGLTTMRPDFVAIAERYFSPAEVRQLKALPAADQFTRFVELWTLKESYVKALGLGLSKPLDDGVFQFHADGLQFRDRQAPAAAVRWRFVLVELAASFRLALAAPSLAWADLKISEVIPQHSLSPLRPTRVLFSRPAPSHVTEI
jgi:4'-phosphopantetheinyl transferase